MPNKDSNLFDQLRSKQLVSVSKSDFSTATDQTYIEECNLDEFKLINVIGQATSQQSQSGPIPGTGLTEVYTATDAEAMQLGFVAEAGEAWVIAAASTGSFYTGQTSAELYITGPSATNATSIDRITAAWYEFNLNEPTVICAPLEFRYSFGGSGSSGTGNIMIARHRVR